MRLIDADALEKEVNTHTKSITPIENDRDMFYHDTGWNGATTAARVAIHHATTIDAVEVVHGTWELYPSHLDRRCSVCKIEYDLPRFNVRAKYCPNCGAKMDGERK